MFKNRNLPPDMLMEIYHIFISTDTSEERIVSSVTNTTKFDVNYAPTLSNTTEITRQQGFVFVNGILGNGTFEHQLPVASATSGDEGYSPLFEINYVKWNNESQARILKSVSEIMDANSKGELYRKIKCGNK
jgi:hypothetical protein